MTLQEADPESWASRGETGDLLSVAVRKAGKEGEESTFDPKMKCLNQKHLMSACQLYTWSQLLSQLL